MIINILIVVVFVIAFGSNLRADYSRNEPTKDLSKPLLVHSIILFYAVNSSGVNSLLIMALFFEGNIKIKNFFFNASFWSM